MNADWEGRWPEPRIPIQREWGNSDSSRPWKRRIDPKAAYCATEGAPVQLAKGMALDHCNDNIRVNTLSPGGVATERGAGGAAGLGGHGAMAPQIGY